MQMSRALVGVALLGAVLLSGCGDDDTNTPAPTKDVDPVDPVDPVAPSCGLSAPLPDTLETYEMELNDGKDGRSIPLTLHFNSASSSSAYLELAIDDLATGVQFGVAGVASGGVQSHFQVTDANSKVWKLQLSQDKKTVALMGKDLSERATDNRYTTMFEEYVLGVALLNLKIVAVRSVETSGSCVPTSYVVDAAPMLIALSGGDPKKTKMVIDVAGIDEAGPKSFKHSIDFTVVYSMPTGPAGVRWCLYNLPFPVMLGRIADNRAGYFYEEFRLLGDYSEKANKWWGERPSDLYHPTINLINRMSFPSRCANTLKKARSADHLHFYIDPTTPKNLWAATVRGINMWDEAFKGVGKGVKAHKPDDSDWPEDYDNADVCFNTISWATGSPGSTFAIGQSVKDPRSGEILKANIIFTLGWLDIWMGRKIIFGATKANRELRKDLRFLSDSAPEGWEEDEESWSPLGNTTSSPELDQSPQLWSILRNPSPEDSLAFLEAGIQDVTAHELGHTVGLRHNFRGSMSIPFDKCHQSAEVEKNGLTASVMDYLGFNIISDETRMNLKSKYGNAVPDADKADFFTPVIGAYDKWVIKYGYSIYASETQVACPMGFCTGTQELKDVADEYDTADFSFATDDTRDSFDPTSVLRDLSDDPIRYYSEQFKVAKEGFDKLEERNLADDTPWTALNGPISTLSNAVHRSAKALTRFIGGVQTIRRHGPGAKKQGLTPTSWEDQKRALKHILDSLVNKELEPPVAYQKNAVTRRNGYQPIYGVYPVKVWDYLNFLKLNTLDSLQYRAVNLRLSEVLLEKEDGELISWLLGECSKSFFKSKSGPKEAADFFVQNTRLETVRAAWSTFLLGDFKDRVVRAAIQTEAEVLRKKLIEVADFMKTDASADYTALQKNLLQNHIH